jgi:hypothetical protein
MIRSADRLGLSDLTLGANRVLRHGAVAPRVVTLLTGAAARDGDAIGVVAGNFVALPA